jgi:hypothetical protein
MEDVMADLTPELADLLVALHTQAEAQRAHIAALTATLGIVIGMARVKGAIDTMEEEQMFAMAEAAMAALGSPAGTAALQPIRQLAARMAGEASRSR